VTAERPTDEEAELQRRLRGPASRGLRRVGWILTAFAMALNLVNAPGVVRSVAKVHNTMGVLWLFSTHAALALALCCLLVPRARGLRLTQRGAIVGLVLALLSLLAFPVSYAATALFSYDGGFNRLF
jgi:hypothetical protein